MAGEASRAPHPHASAADHGSAPRTRKGHSLSQRSPLRRDSRRPVAEPDRHTSQRVANALRITCNRRRSDCACSAGQHSSTVPPLTLRSASSLSRPPSSFHASLTQCELPCPTKSTHSISSSECSTVGFRASPRPGRLHVTRRDGFTKRASSEPAARVATSSPPLRSASWTFGAGMILLVNERRAHPAYAVARALVETSASLAYLDQGSPASTDEGSPRGCRGDSPAYAPRTRSGHRLRGTRGEADPREFDDQSPQPPGRRDASGRRGRVCW